jgi:hypothetical protein
MNLPEGIKHAVHMGANEAFLEWTCDPTEENLETLGSSYQEVVDETTITDEDATRFIADLAAWDDGSVDDSHAARARRFEALMCNAGIDFARGMIAQAANVGSVPDRVKPYLPALAPLVSLLKQALDGDFDEEALNETIWG